MDPNASLEHEGSAGAPLAGASGFGAINCPLQVNPAWNAWSAVRGSPVMPLTKPTCPVEVKPALAGLPPSANGVELKQVAVAAQHGTVPLTSPLSYLQLKPNHGPAFHGWYCKCVVSLNLSSWSIRKTPVAGPMTGTPASCGRKKRAATLDITTSPVKPCQVGTFARIVKPGILDLVHMIG